jgi:hypothetical protein
MAYETELATLTTSVENFNTAVTGKKTSILDPKVTSGLGSQSTAKTHEETTKGYLNETEQFKETTYDSLRSIDSIATQNLAAIAQSKSVTAVDVFVYDTSKDSDGGAWRNRTSKTSWYNETLGTATRGSRKEFPSVAVIVAETTKITIYDADDPSMPMWFTSRNTTTDVGEGVLRSLNAYNPTCVSAKDGKVFVGISKEGDYASNEGLHYLDFVKDEAGKHVTSSTYTGKVTPLTAYPNTNVTPDSSMGVLISADVNDVAMTVLPNAPIDPATDLPVPTIAVATDSGVSVIKDDGSVVDITASTWTLYAKSIKFLDDNKIYFNANSGDAGSRIYYVETIPDADLAYLGSDFQNTSNAYERYIPTVGGAWAGDIILPRPSTYDSAVEAIGNDLAEVNGSVLGRIARKEGDPSNGLHNVTATEYNTGWMLGDTQLATLMSTDDTHISNTNLVKDFFNSSSNWASLAAGTSISGGVFNTDGTTSGDLGRLNNIGIEEGKLYRVTFRISTISAGSLGVKIAGGETSVQNSVGTHEAILKGTSNDNIQLRSTSSAVGTIDNLYVDLVGPIINGDLETNTNWTETLIGTGSSSSHATGQYTITGPDFNNRGERYQDITTIIGRSYITTVEISQDNGAVVVHQTGDETIIGHGNVGTNYFKWVAEATTTRVILRSQSGASIFTNVKVEEAVEDRSRHNSLMALRGGYAVDPVATDAEMVYYDGNDDNDYLEDVTGSITHPGTDYTWAWWGKNPDIVFGTADQRGFMAVVSYNPQVAGYYITLGGSSGNRQVTIRNVDTNIVTTSLTLSQTIDARYPMLDEWTQFVLVKKGNTFSSYINGNLDVVSSNASFATALEGVNHGDNFKIVRTNTSGTSMFRMSTSAATAGQVAKMYRDEKPLFQENAKCTIYGSSTNIKALAYDKDTKLLHVGSSNDGGDGGARSVFKGLQRVLNTTEAAGVAISASNDLVVEE